MESSNLSLVSVVIPCYNHEQFVQDCIQSVIDQTYLNIELIIIDDGSKDSSVDKIQQLIPACEQRFTRFEFRSRPNKGLSATLNEALEWCEGEYYSAIASDDQMLSNKTSLQVAYLNNNKECMAVFGGVQLIDENNLKLEGYYGAECFYSFDQIILHRHEIFTPTQMMRLEPIKNIGGYKPDMVIEDWYMWLKLSQIGGLYCMPNIMCFYRRHNNNTSSNYDKMYQARLHVLKEFKTNQNYNNATKEVEWIYLREVYPRNINLKYFKFIFNNFKWFLRRVLRNYLA